MNAGISRGILHEVNSAPVLALVRLFHAVDPEIRGLLLRYKIRSLMQILGHPLRRLSRVFSSDVVAETKRNKHKAVIEGETKNSQ